MFYRLLGMVVWKASVRYVRSIYGRQLRAAFAFGVLGVIVAGYLGTRSSE
jgi:hypothetical protein